MNTTFEPILTNFNGTPLEFGIPQACEIFIQQTTNQCNEIINTFNAGVWQQLAGFVLIYLITVIGLTYLYKKDVKKYQKRIKELENKSETESTNRSE